MTTDTALIGTAAAPNGGALRRLCADAHRVARGKEVVARWLQTDQYGDYRSVELARWSRGRH